MVYSENDVAMFEQFGVDGVDIKTVKHILP